MRIFTESLFKSSESLVADLEKKSKNYPLTVQLYLPVIERHAKKYQDFTDFDDWLLVTYFKLMWHAIEQTDYGEQCRLRLTDIEHRLGKIYTSIGGSGFEAMCQDLLKDAMDPAVNGVHWKILDFYAELKAIEYYIDKGYSIERIPPSVNKMPDFRAKKNDGIVLVEVKFIHPSNPIKDYISRYIAFLSGLSDSSFNIKTHFGMATGQSFSYRGKLGNFKQKDFNGVKQFINAIFRNNENPKKLELERSHTTEICYRREDKIPACLVTIENQILFCIEQLTIFLNDYVLRRKEQAKTKFGGSYNNTCVYILVQHDEKDNPPYDEFYEQKSNAIEAFIQEQAKTEEGNIILDFINIIKELKP